MISRRIPARPDRPVHHGPVSVVAQARPGGGRYPPGDPAGEQDWTVCRSPGLVDYAKTWPPGHHVKER